MRTTGRIRNVTGILLAAALALSVAAPAIADAGHGQAGGQGGGQGDAKAKAAATMPGHDARTSGPGKDTAGKDTADDAAASSIATTGLLMPMMNPARGRKVFAAKGCVVCHAINGVGGDHGPQLDMSRMGPMNPFDFAAKMWEGAAAMIVLQEEELGERISLTGQDLADMIAFVHSASEIAKFSEKDVPHRIMDVFRRTHGKDHVD